jgi:O-acetyl-ADP-ribose deacetylase (regulator of RNase III)
MSIQFVKGNLLNWKSDDGLSNWNVLVHGVNCKCAFASGLAGQIRAKYPEAYNKYMHSCQEKDLEGVSDDVFLGTFSVALVEGGKRIVNLATQKEYGRDKNVVYLSYDALKIGMETLRAVLEWAGKEGRAYSLGIPHQIGCGLANGDWGKVKIILTEVWEKSSIPVYIVEFNQTTNN